MASSSYLGRIAQKSIPFNLTNLRFKFVFKSKIQPVQSRLNSSKIETFLLSGFVKVKLSVKGFLDRVQKRAEAFENHQAYIGQESQHPYLIIFSDEIFD